MKKVPYGINDYKTLQEDGYLYVDKTMYLEKLEDTAKTIIYHRPDGFGKSLFTSMMFYYYNVNSESLFDTLFKDTYVYDNPTKNKNNYYVLKFDFSNIIEIGMDIDAYKEKFNNKVIEGIKTFLDYYNLHDYEEKIKFDYKYPNGILLEFLGYFRSLKLDKKLYILINEYDSFTNGVLNGDTTLFRGVDNETDFVQAFYALIKEYMGNGIIDRFFATGICPVDLKVLSGGFNIATTITADFMFNSMLGLTKTEIEELLGEYDKDIKDEIYDTMIKNYGGYLFSKRLGEEDRVLNANLVMYFLEFYNKTGKYPEELADNNNTINHEKLENLLKLQGNDVYKKIINRLLENGEIIARLNTLFYTAKDFSQDDIISLLYYFGYLTINKEESGGILSFKIPNHVTHETYNK